MTPLTQRIASELAPAEVLSMCDWMATLNCMFCVMNVTSLVMGPLPQLLCYEMGPLVRLYIIKDAITLDQKF